MASQAVRDAVRRWTARHGQTPAQRAFWLKAKKYDADCKVERKPRARDGIKLVTRMRRRRGLPKRMVRERAATLAELAKALARPFAVPVMPWQEPTP